jgi:hypothetical protein
MIPSDLAQFKQINAIIERDSKDATYKFALLRGAIEISQEYDHLKRDSGDRVEFPLGLLVEKWLLYYFPLIASPDFIPQKNGESKNSQYQIAFRKSFRKITEYYDTRGGFSAFYSDYVNGKIPNEIDQSFRELVSDLKTTITGMPMKHLGYSVYRQHYSLFKDEKGGRRIPGGAPLGQEILVRNLGYFSFSKELYTVFRYLGSFISGEDSLLFQWAEFTRSASKGDISVEYALEKIRTFPITERDVGSAKSFYENLFKKEECVECVWSGKPLQTMKSVHIDHFIPFSVWKNNDLWNLLPASNQVNRDKKDKIPKPEFIDKRKTAIKKYWSHLRKELPKKFERELSISLTGAIDPQLDWQEIAIEHLKEKCAYLIDVRGFDAWSLK